MCNLAWNMCSIIRIGTVFVRSSLVKQSLKFIVKCQFELFELSELSVCVRTV